MKLNYITGFAKNGDKKIKKTRSYDGGFFRSAYNIYLSG